MKIEIGEKVRNELSKDEIEIIVDILNLVKEESVEMIIIKPYKRKFSTIQVIDKNERIIFEFVIDHRFDFVAELKLSMGNNHTVITLMNIVRLTTL